jgi:L-alanine-DL-glutamate epimerase-like enolase superfamily enzyme
MTLTKERIVELLSTNDRAVCRALVVLNERQTKDEQVREATTHQNNRGFRPCHARMGTNMAQFFTRTGYLSPKQVAYWRRTDKNGTMRIAIYWRQLLEEAEKKASEK